MVAVPAVPSFPAGSTATSTQMKQITDLLTVLALARPVARFRQGTATTSIPNALYTAINFDTTDFDTDGGRAAQATLPTQYVSKTKGYYLVSALVTVQGNGTGARFVRLAVNGNAVQGATSMVPYGYANSARVQVTHLVHLNVGDYVECQYYQDSGTTLLTVINVDDTSVMEVALQTHA